MVAVLGALKANDHLADMEKHYLGRRLPLPAHRRPVIAKLMAEFAAL